jgi:hypothetical protein
MKSEVLFITIRTKRNGGKARQPYELRQRPVAAALPASERQDQAGQARLRMDIDRREINRLHQPAPAEIDIKPAVACLQRGTDRRGPVVRRRRVPAFHDRDVAFPQRSSVRRPRRNAPVQLRSSWPRPAAMPSVCVANVVCRPWASLQPLQSDQPATLCCMRSRPPDPQPSAASGP